MERYDGKTRKDDIRKWLLIGIPAALVLIGIIVGTNLLKKATAPDYTVVTMCDPALNEAVMDDIKAAAGAVIGDRNGNGSVKIAIKELRPGPLGTFDESVSVMFNGDYTLFLITAPDRWTEDILAERVNLKGTKLWYDLNRTEPVYGCILNTDEDDMAEAQKIIDALIAQEVPEQ